MTTEVEVSPGAAVAAVLRVSFSAPPLSQQIREFQSLVVQAAGKIHDGYGRNLSVVELAVLHGALQGVLRAEPTLRDFILAQTCLNHMPTYSPGQIQAALEHVVEGLRVAIEQCAAAVSAGTTTTLVH